MHLAIEPEQRAVGVDHRGTVAIDPRRLPLIERHDEHHRELLRDRLQARHRGSGDLLREIEAARVERLAEVGGVEELLQADHLRPLRVRVPDPPLGGDEGRRGGGLHPVLDQGDGEGDAPGRAHFPRAFFTASPSSV